FYNEELTLTEIGHVLDLTTSRISQIHKNAVYKLKDVLNKIQKI
ncbi:RNA polymerase sigma factor FliA, partial [Ralstonia pickettii]|nr:RNA polymerase sigma factor FliA [Ralstonia pickettii]